MSGPPRKLKQGLQFLLYQVRDQGLLGQWVIRIIVAFSYLIFLPSSLVMEWVETHRVGPAANCAIRCVSPRLWGTLPCEAFWPLFVCMTGEQVSWREEERPNDEIKNLLIQAPLRMVNPVPAAFYEDCSEKKRRNYSTNLLVPTASACSVRLLVSSQLFKYVTIVKLCDWTTVWFPFRVEGANFTKCSQL